MAPQKAHGDEEVVEMVVEMTSHNMETGENMKAMKVMGNFQF